MSGGRPRAACVREGLGHAPAARAGLRAQFVLCPSLFPLPCSYAEVAEGLNDTAENLLKSIDSNHSGGLCNGRMGILAGAVEQAVQPSPGLQPHPPSSLPLLVPCRGVPLHALCGGLHPGGRALHQRQARAHAARAPPAHCTSSSWFGAAARRHAGAATARLYRRQPHLPPPDAAPAVPRTPLFPALSSWPPRRTCSLVAMTSRAGRRR